MIDPIVGIAFVLGLLLVTAFGCWVHYKLGYYAGRRDERSGRRLP